MFRPERAAIHKEMARLGAETVQNLLYTKQADNAAKAPAGLERAQALWHEAQKIYDELISEGACCSIHELKISGEDLAALGYHGREIGAVLARLLDEVASEKLKNTPAALRVNDMANLMDYLDWRGDLTLEISPFNEVDALILAELSFVDFDGIVPPPELGRGLPLNEAAEAFFARHGGKDVPMGVLVPDTISKMLRKLMTSPRFRNMTLNGYTALLDDSIEQQFAALTIDLGNGSIYISFRGTDDTIVGWKEDLNMGFLEEIPSQKQAVEYVARVARQYSDKTIRIGGHSKGGNLAVYSAAKSSGEIQERIVAVHNNDGPGFAWDISETPGHKRIASRIHTILPQTSVVGMLMEHEKRYQVVHSTYDGLYQHDGFSWQVLGTQFVHLDDFSREGKLVDETLSSWADSLNTQQREALADALYSVFTASGAKTLSELTEEKLKSAAAMLKTYKNLDRETRRMVTEAFMLFFKLGTKNFVLDTQEEGSREIENIRKKISEQYQKLVERKK